MTSSDLSALVATFEQVASDIVIAHDGRVVKTLGDEVMFMITDPLQAALTGLALSEAFGHDDGSRAAGPGRSRLRRHPGPRRRHFRAGGESRQPLHRHRPARHRGVRPRAGPNLETRSKARMRPELGPIFISRLRTFRVRGLATWPRM